MALEIKTDILIAAPPEKVWKVLTNFAQFPNWNPFLKSLTGKMEVGQKITVTIAPAGQKPMTFSPQVLSFEPNREMSWIGRLLFAGLFDGEHKFELFPNGDGTTTFVQRENFKGLLVPFFRKSLNTNTNAGFEAMNQALKAQAEGRA